MALGNRRKSKEHISTSTKGRKFLRNEGVRYDDAIDVGEQQVKSTGVATGVQNMIKPEVVAVSREARNLALSFEGKERLEDIKTRLASTGPGFEKTLQEEYDDAWPAFSSFQSLSTHLYQQNSDMDPERVEKYTNLYNDLEVLALVANGGGTSAYDVESFYSVKARVKAQVDEFLTDEVAQSSTQAMEALLQDPSLYSTPTRNTYSQDGDLAFVASRTLVDTVEKNPTPERWSAAIDITGKMFDEGHSDAAATALKGLVDMRRENPALQAVNIESEKIKKYAKRLADAGLLSSP